jgi:16S rRNA processing protein RimM
VSRAPDRVAVGRIVRAHGIHGAVAILRLTDVDERFEAGSRLLLGEAGDRVLTVSDRRGHRDRPLVRFDGVRDRSAAEALIGSYLFVAASESPDLPAGAFWEHELLGMVVATEAGLELGTVTQVLRTTANDIWVTTDADGNETLVPALKDVVLGVDGTARRITVAEVPGLTVPEGPGAAASEAETTRRSRR